MWGWKPWHQQWVEGFLALAVRDRITAVLLLILHLRGQSTCIPIVVLFMLALRKRVLQNEQTHVFVPRFAAPGQMHRIDFKQHWSHRSAFDHTLTSSNTAAHVEFLFNLFSFQHVSCAWKLCLHGPCAWKWPSTTTAPRGSNFRAGFPMETCMEISSGAR